MQEERFRNWLSAERRHMESTVSSRMSNCRRVEQFEGDLDAQWEADRLDGLTDRLTYSREDERNRKQPNHEIPIDGDVYNGTAMLKTAVSLYRDFRGADDETPNATEASGDGWAAYLKEDVRPYIEGGELDREVQSLEELADELLYHVSELERIEYLLHDKRQVIFQGPPGTGKTYAARKLARFLAGSDDRVTLVQFHPSYAYEDFVQGYRPTLTAAGQAGFALRDGPLVTAAAAARAEPHSRHFLIIDEINRGNLAKVLGELYFLLEYRDEGMALQYAKGGDEPFSLPKNLYVIGTMNTADRSIALVDLALRRRFHFVEFHPDKPPVDGLLRRWLMKNAPNMAWLVEIVKRANVELGNHKAAIGPSYFMKEDLDEKKARLIWEHNVLPYIEEHLYGRNEQFDEFDFDKLRRAAEAGDATSDSSGEEAVADLVDDGEKEAAGHAES